MKSILIIYNSGAGSTKTIAEVYYSLLSEYQIGIMSVSTPFDYSVLNGYDLIIFGFPCYHCDLSGLMKDFMDKIPVQSQKVKAFAFLTYGLYGGNTLRKFIKRCRKKNIYVEDYADYKAPATDGSLMLPPFSMMYRYEKKIASNISKDIENVKRIINTERFHSKPPRYKLYTLLNYPNEYFGKKLKVTIKVREDVCTKCYLCVKQCAWQCWTENGSYPVFDKTKCDMCYRCIHQCPQEALVFSKKTISKRKLNTRFYKQWKDNILTGIENLNTPQE